MLVIWAMFFAVSWRLVMRERRRAIALETEYHLYALRDELRDYAAASHCARRSWLFSFLDRTLSRMVVLAPRTTVWQLATVMVKMRGDKKWNEFQRHLSREMGRPENKKLCEIHGHAIAVANSAVYQRQILLFKVASALMLVSKTARRVEAARIRALRWLSEPSEAPGKPDTADMLCPVLQ